ncbi:MAG: hypothetical protein WD294_12235 [Phycisphaeraceae bacterium]
MSDITFTLKEIQRDHYGYERRTGELTSSSTREDADPIGSCEIRTLLEEHAARNSGKVKTDISSYRGNAKHYDGGITQDVVTTLAVTFSASGGALIFFKFGKDLLLQWMKNMSSRSVRLKMGDKEIEIKGTNDVEKAMKLLDELDRRTSHADDETDP